MTDIPEVAVDDAAPEARATGALLLAVVSAAVFFDALDLSITQIALPSIRAELHVAAGTLPWIAAGYVVTYGGFLLLGGRAADLLGARPVFRTGLAVFGLASLACGLAGNAATLVGARAVQGVGAACTVPAAIAILATAFTDERARNRAFGVFAAAAASGFSVGLVLGGILTDGLSWRWIFLAKVPAVALVLIGALRAVPPTPRHGGGRYDLAGAITATAGAVLFTYGVIRAGSSGASAVDIAAPIAAAVAMLVLFVLIERRSPAPLLPGHLLRVRGLAAVDAATLTVLAAPFGVSFVVTVYLQDALHHSAWSAALVLLPGAVLCVAVSRYAAPALVERLGLRTVFVGGLLVVAAGDAMLLGLNRTDWMPLTIVATLVAFGLGMGTAYPAATMGGVRGVAAADQGAAAGLNNSALQIGGAIGLALVATAVNFGPGGRSLAEIGSAAGTSAVHAGALAATLIPLAGAAIATLARAPHPPLGTTARPDAHAVCET